MRLIKRLDETPRLGMLALCGLAGSLCWDAKAASARHIRLREVARMRGTFVVDQTTDGRHLLFFDGDASWGYRINVHRGRVTARQERFPVGNSLRVVQSGTWATVARIECSECYTARFSPSGRGVFYYDFVRVDGKLKLTSTFWEAATGSARSCPDVDFSAFAFLDAFQHR